MTVAMTVSPAQAVLGWAHGSSRDRDLNHLPDSRLARRDLVRYVPSIAIPLSPLGTLRNRIFKPLAGRLNL